MSQTTLWVVAVVAVLAALAWWGGLFNSIPGFPQGAAVGTNAPAATGPAPENVTNESFARDLAAIDAEIKVNAADLALADVAFAAKMSVVSDRVQNIATSLRELSRKLEPRVAMKNQASLTASWNDIGIRTSNATSLASSAKTKADLAAAQISLVEASASAAIVLAGVK